MNAPPDLLARTIAEIQCEGAGVLRFEVVRPEDAQRLIVAAWHGDDRAVVRLRAIVAYAESVFDPRSGSHRCLCCPNAVTTAEGTTFILAMAERDDPGVCLGAGVCGECAAVDMNTLRRMAQEGFRVCWPDLRPIEIQTSGGRA